MLTVKAKRWVYYITVGIISAAIILLALPSVLRSIDKVRQEMSEQTAEAAIPEDAEIPPPVQQSEYEKIGESDRLILYFRSSDSAIKVQDKTNGYQWKSAVSLDDVETDGNELWTASSQSIFHMTYTDPSLPALETQETNSVIEQPSLSTTPMDNGILVHYELPRLKISFDMSFQLKGDALDVTIPAESIKESKNNWIMSIAPLPFFGAASDHQQGYAFYPDGPGAISYFKSNHPNYLNPYKASVYGPDTITFNYFNRREQSALLPVFGLKVEDNAFLGMITDGEYDANVLYSPSGYLINLNRVSSEFVYRRDYEAVKRNGNLTKQAEKELIREDHTVRYVFFSGDDADYSRMAAAYRNFLVDEKGLKSRIQQGDPIPYGLDLLTGIKKHQILIDAYISTTTFSQAQSIMEDLKKRGVERISANLLGWTGKGYLEYPSDGKPAPELGGMSGLQKLSDFTKKNGYQLFLQDNFIEAWKNSGGFSTRTDVVKGANHFAVTDRFNEMFYLNARKRNLAFQNHYLDPLSKLNITGINFDGIGSLVYYDYNDDYPLLREGTAKQWLEMMDTSRKQFGGAAVVGGNGYGILMADRVFDAPMDDSGYFFTDEVVPFYQMVLHGYVPYSGNPQNLFYDPDLQYLKMVEYGYMPYYQLTADHSEELKDTYYSDLFSSDYDNWVDRSVEQYKEMNERLRPLWPQTIVGHRKVQSDVYETTYEDGTRVIVNYLPRGIIVDGHTIPEKDFIVVPKGG
ncbi:DUF5696 domain-containing protein [Paenibacillus thermotolerans]|uniref:DUF5696 domain-containing protein n=1 Tax=Paenibacillus thermotolerans TaxID=3027807 RepID=UPI002367CFA7|nr:MULTISPECIES: DUF5696 domain-containing protein [unclassified Paenibacillus]